LARLGTVARKLARTAQAAQQAGGMGCIARGGVRPGSAERAKREADRPVRRLPVRELVLERPEHANVSTFETELDVTPAAMSRLRLVVEPPDPERGDEAHVRAHRRGNGNGAQRASFLGSTS
jgi:hypothetical protein